jgi:hypothetical protein
MDHPSVPALMKALTDRARIGRWYNTQENAYALLALGKIGRALGTQDFTGVIRVGGQEVKTFTHQSPAMASSDSADWVGKEVEVEIRGTGVAFISAQIEGIRAGLLEPKSKGLVVSRALYTKGGKPIAPTELTQGELVVVKIVLSTPLASRIYNVALVDLLPAGLEIENPRLTNEAMEPWMNDRSYPDYLDIRDDRMLLFTHVWPGRNNAFYYTARAVTAGEFVLPHVHAEAMYDPQTQGYAGGGRAVVKARE